jgi:hypothetical protein
MDDYFVRSLYKMIRISEIDLHKEPPGKMTTSVANNNNNSVALLRERTIPTDRLPLVGEVSASF